MNLHEAYYEGIKRASLNSVPQKLEWYTIGKGYAIQTFKYYHNPF